MDRGEVLLQQFRSRLNTWLDVIRRGTGAYEVRVIPRVQGEFDVLVRWKNKDGTDGLYLKEFTRGFVFSHTHQLHEHAWYPDKMPCEYAKDIIRDILNLRGVL